MNYGVIYYFSLKLIKFFIFERLLKKFKRLWTNYARKLAFVTISDISEYSESGIESKFSDTPAS